MAFRGLYEGGRRGGGRTTVGSWAMPAPPFVSRRWVFVIDARRMVWEQETRQTSVSSYFLMR